MERRYGKQLDGEPSSQKLQPNYYLGKSLR
jgi:hypothetical protein